MEYAGCIMSDIGLEREHAFELEQTVAQLRLEETQRAHDRDAELHRTYFEAASKSAEVAVKTSVLVNGGAAVAVLGFLGAMLGKNVVTLTQVANVSASLVWFASGVAAGVAALALIYLMNYSSAAGVRWRRRIFIAPYVEETPRSRLMRRIYTVAHIIAVLISLLSVSLFVYGVVDMRHSINHISKPVPSAQNAHRSQ